MAFIMNALAACYKVRDYILCVCSECEHVHKTMSKLKALFHISIMLVDNPVCILWYM